MLAVACGASTTDTASDVVVLSTPSFTAEPIATVQPTAVPEATATAPPEPTATLDVATLLGSSTTEMSPGDFALAWDRFTSTVVELMPEAPEPPALVDPATGIYAELELNAYKLGDGVLLATSLADGQIDGYVAFLDPNDFRAIQALVLLSLSLGEPAVVDAVVDAISLGESQLSNVPRAFDGVDYRIEVLRTGVDPVNDPLWVLTVLPMGSTVDHGRLRLAGAEAASATF